MQPQTEKLVRKGKDDSTDKEADHPPQQHAADGADEDNEHRDIDPAPHEQGFEYAVAGGDNQHVDGKNRFRRAAALGEDIGDDGADDDERGDLNDGQKHDAYGEHDGKRHVHRQHPGEGEGSLDRRNTDDARRDAAYRQCRKRDPLFGTIGYNPTDATGNWVGGSKAVGISAGPSFSWNIWQYDRIRNRIRAQDAAFELRLIDYNKKVLQAVGEVDSALSGYRFARIQLDEIEHALDATVRAFNLSATQYNDGLVSYQRLLSTVERLTTIQDRYAQIKGALATDSVLLYKALGGGWRQMGGTHYLSKERAARMRTRTDWGEYLDDNATLLPEKLP